MRMFLLRSGSLPTDRSKKSGVCLWQTTDHSKSMVPRRMHDRRRKENVPLTIDEILVKKVHHLGEFCIRKRFFNNVFVGKNTLRFVIVHQVSFQNRPVHNRPVHKRPVHNIVNVVCFIFYWKHYFEDSVFMLSWWAGSSTHPSSSTRYPPQASVNHETKHALLSEHLNRLANYLAREPQILSSAKWDETVKFRCIHD